MAAREGRGGGSWSVKEDGDEEEGGRVGDRKEKEERRCHVPHRFTVFGH